MKSDARLVSFDAPRSALASSPQNCCTNLFEEAGWNLPPDESAIALGDDVKTRPSELVGIVQRNPCRASGIKSQSTNETLRHRHCESAFAWTLACYRHNSDAR